MPAVRPLSTQPSHRHEPTSASQSKSKRHIESLLDGPSSPELQELPHNQRSSSKPQKPTRRPTKPAFVPPPPEEIIEISSDEDEPPLQQSQAGLIADYRRQINSLREESAKAKRNLERVTKDLAKYRDEVHQLRSTVKPGKGKLVLEAERLSDELDCEICTRRMLTPMMLSDCGHTYCEPCLRDWFEATLKTFMTTHPTYDPKRPYQNAPQAQMLMEHLIHNNQLLHNPQMMAMLEAYFPPQPTYTCPTCRKPATVRPREVYALKSLIRMVATAAGEQIPPQPSLAPTTRAGGRSSGQNPDVWERFFPNMT